MPRQSTSHGRLLDPTYSARIPRESKLYPVLSEGLLRIKSRDTILSRIMSLAHKSELSPSFWVKEGKYYSLSCRSYSLQRPRSARINRRIRGGREYGVKRAQPAKERARHCDGLGNVPLVLLDSMDLIYQTFTAIREF